MTDFLISTAQNLILSGLILVIFHGESIKRFDDTRRKLLFFYVIFTSIVLTIVLYLVSLRFVLSLIVDAIIIRFLIFFFGNKELWQILKAFGLDRQTKNVVGFVAIFSSIIINILWYSCKNIFLFLKGLIA